MTPYNLTADGSTEAFRANGEFRVHVSGAFGAGTLVVEEDILGNGNFETIVGSARQEADDYVVDGVALSTYRFTLSGSTSPDIDIVAKGSLG